MISLLIALFTLEVLMIAVWAVGYKIQKTSIVDVFWGLLIWIAAGVYFFWFRSSEATSALYFSLVGFWAVRLSLYIYFRNRSHGEDPRYQALRDKWGAQEKKRMLIFFWQQGLAAWIFSLPFFVLFADPRPGLGPWQIAGCILWLIAVAGETLSDAQLAAFKKNSENKGKACRSGFWRYSRHPNYFFEWLHWVSYAWLAWPHRAGWIALICPAAMYYLLNKVSGIPHAEKQSIKSRTAEYTEYQRITSPFFPWFPKRSDFLK